MDGQKVFVFCNPSSGGNRAGRLLELPSNALTFDQLCVSIFNLKNAESKQAGFAQLAAHCKNAEGLTRVIAAGGDGTIKWVMEEICKIGSLDRVAMGVIPFGTGNDMSRVLGWKSTAPRRLDAKGFQTCISQIIKQGELVDLDVWRVEYEVESRHIASSRSTTYVKKDGIHQEYMINYVSVGQDAKAVFNFELNRRGSQFRNKLQFGIEGGKLSLPSLKSKTSQLASAELFLDGDRMESVPLNKQGLIFQNIPSYAAGSDFWQQRSWDPQYATTAQFAPQLMGDKRLEVHGLHQVLDIALHKATLGMRRATEKLGQSAHVRVNLKQQKQEDVYLQVDGEPCRLVRAERLDVSFAFQIKMLKRNQNYHRAARRASDALIKSFLLHRSSGKRGGKWSEVFVELTSEGDLRFGPTCKHVIPASAGIRAHPLPHETGPRPNTCFQVVTSRKANSHVFACQSTEERDAWIHAFLTLHNNNEISML